MARELVNEVNLVDYRTRVTLDGDTFDLRWRFSVRLSSWFVDIFDVSGDVLVYGRRIVADGFILSQNRHTVGIPAGELMPFDTTFAKRDPKLGELGDRVIMLYLTEAEVDELEAAI